ncbi:hypothetical protein U1Q18_033097, partial [Sarracenia purpurea var. burkii]
ENDEEEDAGVLIVEKPVDYPVKDLVFQSERDLVLPIEPAASIGEDDGRTVDRSMVVASARDCEVVLVVCHEWRRRF